jgi:cytoskeletal protein RodZ
LLNLDPALLGQIVTNQTGWQKRREKVSIMDSPGNCLKKERELQNLSLGEISKSTRIKEHFLRAIEEDHYNLCPSPFYVKGFLTNYARCLGLDPQGIILQYQDLIKPPPPPSEETLQENREKTFRFRPKIQTRIQSRTTFRLLLVSALLLSLLIPLYFYVAFQPAEAPNSPSPSSQEPVPPQVVQEKETRPVIEQIKQMELIGPKEVQAEALYEVTEAHLGTGIETENGRLQVVGRGSEFKCENQKIYFFTRITTPREGKIFHVWRCEGEEQHRIEMPVKSPSWSVYSYISLSPARSGNWKVEVWEGDKMLKDVSFGARSPKMTSSPS